MVCGGGSCDGGEVCGGIGVVMLAPDTVGGI